MESKKSFFSPEALQMFTLSVSGLGADEIKKHKELYVRNAITEYHGTFEKDKAESFLLMFFGIIPFFWPFIYSWVRNSKAGREEKKAQIENALLVWKDDLYNKHTDLLTLLNKDIELKESKKLIWPLSIITK